MTARAPSAVRSRSRTRLVLAVRGGRTVLAVSDVGAPVKAIRPFELPDGRAMLQLISAAPGLFGGDEHELEIVAEAGARACVAAAAATKIHAMPDGSIARQSVRLEAARGASLEYFPGRNIPFPDAALEQRITATMAPDARLAIIESWAMGRIHRGERLQFRRLSARTTIDRGGQPLYRDALELAPEAGRLPESGLLEGARYIAAGVWCGPATADDPAAAAEILGADAALGAFAPGCWYLRGLFSDGIAADDAVSSAQAALNAVWGQSAYDADRFQP